MICHDVWTIIASYLNPNETLNFVKKLHPPIITKEMITYHVENGNLEVVKWLETFSVLFRPNHFIIACENGHFDLVKRLHVSLSKQEYVSKFLNQTVFNVFSMESENDSFEDKSSLRKQKDLIKKYILSQKDYQNAFNMTCKNGHLEIAKWLITQSKVKMDVPFSLACENGHLEVAKWLGDINISILYDVNDPFYLACEQGHLEVVKWLFQFRPNVYYQQESAFKFACANGHLEVVKWLIQFKFDLLRDGNSSFRYSCENGHLEVAKFLYEHEKDISSGFTYAFCSACENGYLELVKWLCEIRPDLIDGVKSLAFRFTCEQGQLDVLKWLIQFDPEIYPKCYGLARNHQHVLDWLETLEHK